MTDYKVYQGIDDRKVYVAVSAEKTPQEAIKIANAHLKLNKLCVKVEAGYTKGKDLYLGYPEGSYKFNKPVWVVSRK